MSKIRLERINSEMQKSLSDIINNRMNNPEVTGMISIMRVEVDADFKNAKAHVSIFGGNRQKVIDAINKSAKFIRHEIAREFRDLRTVPQFVFVLDDSLEYAQHVNELIEKTKKK